MLVLLQYKTIISVSPSLYFVSFFLFAVPIVLSNLALVALFGAGVGNVVLVLVHTLIASIAL